MLTGIILCRVYIFVSGLKVGIKKRNRVECYRYHLLHPTLVVSSATQGSTVYPLPYPIEMSFRLSKNKSNKESNSDGKNIWLVVVRERRKFFFNQVEGNLNGFICSYSCCQWVYKSSDMMGKSIICQNCFDASRLIAQIKLLYFRVRRWPPVSVNFGAHPAQSKGVTHSFCVAAVIR